MKESVRFLCLRKGGQVKKRQSDTVPSVIIYCLTLGFTS